MRWVFYSLVVVNLAYLGWQLVMVTFPEAPVSAEHQLDKVIEGPTLRLLREAPQPRRDQTIAASDRRPGSCPVVGPWLGKEEAERARIQLAAAGLEGSVQALELHKDHLSWVYLPAYRNREQALEMLGELQARGVDSFIVKTGEDANAISLGYFSSPESAEGLRVKMRNAGYPAFVRDTYRPVTEYWLYLPMRAAEASALADFLAGNPDVERDRAACKAGLAGVGS